ncbi:MAG: glycosyltransferase [Patescibacteria group bacterium]|nr:glycosyltransferase [Patescibacteria group bacterium]
MISSDRKIFERGSPVAERVISYGALVEKLHIIVFTRAVSAEFERFENKNLGRNISVYPTNSKNKWQYVRDAYRIGKTLKNIDLVTAQDPFEAGFSAWRIAKKLKAKLQLQVHTDFLSPFFAKESFLNFLRVRMARFLLPRASCVRVVSERIKNSLVVSLGLPVTKITVLPIFVDTKRVRDASARIDLHLRYPQFDFIVLMASRLTPEKNIALALRAFQKVAKKYPKTGLIVIGEGSENHTLGLLATNLNLQGNVIFDGWQTDLISYYKTADLFLLTSNYEGYGMTLIEAASAGRPMVSTDVGVVGDLINAENALICAVGDETCITQSIRRVIENKGLRERLEQAAAMAIEQMPERSNEQYIKKCVQGWQNCS